MFGGWNGSRFRLDHHPTRTLIMTNTLYMAWPYAAKAIIQYDFDVGTNRIQIWITFRHPMDQTVKPLDAQWIVMHEAVPKAVTASAWQDAYTMWLLVPACFWNPVHLTVEYDGPCKELWTTWHKQWEPWGPILALDITT